MLFTVTAFCFTIQFNIIKLDYLFPDTMGAASIGLYVFLIIVILLPCHLFYLRARKEMVKVLFNIIISPFGSVKFRHFFLADMLTSFTQPFKDLGITMCYFFGQYYDQKQQREVFYWETSTIVNPTNHTWLINYFYVVSILPLWFRFA